MKNETKETTVKSIFDDNAEVTALLTEIKAGAERYSRLPAGSQEYAAYHELGAIKAELHMMANKFPEVEAYLAAVNADRAKVVQF
jgi:hypothetical protein